MPRYRVLRDFGSHLGNHYRGEHITLPEGALPRGFAGFLERADEPQTKDVVPAPDGPASSRSEAGPVPPASDSRPEPEPPPTPAARAEAGYEDRMLRPRRRR